MRLVGLVGKGVYGSVYATSDNLAVKVLRDHAVPEDEIISRARELFIGSLSDTRLGSVYFHDTKEFATLTELANCTLGELAPAGHIPTHAKRILGKELLLELVKLHSNGIIHRDLKPANVVVYLNPLRLRIIDFGISTISKFSFETEVYSLWYRAPEIIRGKGHTEKADIWAFGVMLASWCGKQILVCETVEQLDQAITHLKVVSPDIQDILDMCLHQDPEQRPSASALLSHSFWSKPPFDEKEARTYLCGFEEYKKEKILDVNDPQVLVPPSYSKMKITHYHIRALCDIGKTVCLSMDVALEILLMVALTEGPSRQTVAGSAFLAQCIFSDDIPSLAVFAKAAKLSVPVLVKAINTQTMNLGGVLLNSTLRTAIFKLPEWEDVQKALKRHFD